MRCGRKKGVSLGVGKRRCNNCAVSIAREHTMNIGSSGSGHERRGSGYGLLLTVAEKIVTFAMVNLNLVKAFAFVYVGLTVDGFRNFTVCNPGRRISLLGSSFNAIRIEEDDSQAEYAYVASHRFHRFRLASNCRLAPLRNEAAAAENLVPGRRNERTGIHPMPASDRCQSECTRTPAFTVHGELFYGNEEFDDGIAFAIAASFTDTPTRDGSTDPITGTAPGSENLVAVSITIAERLEM